MTVLHTVSRMLRTMRKAVPIVSMCLWALWLIRALAMWLNYRPSTSGLTSQDLPWFVLTYSIQVAGIAFSFLLWKRPSRAFALVLALLSLFSLWKYFFGIVVLRTFSAFGGLSFSSAIGEWWHFRTVSTLDFLKEVPFALFLLLSVFFWPIYVIRLPKDKVQASTIL